MTITADKTVREIAVEYPATIRVFERFGIDYCCGGRKPLEQACEELQLSTDQVREKLTEALGGKTEEDLASLMAAPLRRGLGVRGLTAVERLMGLVLVTLAVQMLMTGVVEFLRVHP